MWNALKKSLPRYSTTKDLYNVNFAEYCIRKKFLSRASDKFLQVLHLVAIVYKPPAQTNQQPEPAEPVAVLCFPAVDPVAIYVPSIRHYVGTGHTAGSVLMACQSRVGVGRLIRGS